MMNHPVVSVAVTLAILFAFGYYLKLDMADMTGLARGHAKQGMSALADQLGYSLLDVEAESKQRGLEKNFGRYKIEVDCDGSQIEVDFNKELGLFLFSMPDRVFDQNKFQGVSFSQEKLNKLFRVRAVSNRKAEKIAAIESALFPLGEQFLSRKVKYIYIENEYLRIGFEHNNYLPVSLIENAIPVVEQVAKQLVQVK